MVPTKVVICQYRTKPTLQSRIYIPHMPTTLMYMSTFYFRCYIHGAYQAVICQSRTKPLLQSRIYIQHMPTTLMYTSTFYFRCYIHGAYQAVICQSWTKPQLQSRIYIQHMATTLMYMSTFYFRCYIHGAYQGGNMSVSNKTTATIKNLHPAHGYCIDVYVNILFQVLYTWCLPRW